MAHQNFDTTEFVSVRYYLGTHGGPASTARVNYYGTGTATPQLWFNGGEHIVGAGSDAATGEGYMAIIGSKYFDASPIRIDVDFSSPASGAVDVTVTMYSTTYSISGGNLRIVLYEDEVPPATPGGEDATHATRDVYNDTITLSGAGNTAVFNHTFTLNPSWNTDHLRVAAFVQLADQSIIQVGTGDSAPDFKVRAMVPGPRSAIGPSFGMYESGNVTVMNVGLGDTFDISAVIDEAPAGWTVAFKDDSGTTHTNPLSFGLTAEESKTFKSVIVPNSPGFARYRLVVTSPNLSGPMEIPFVYITDDVDVLVVDDDGGEAYEEYFTAALGSAGKTYGIWDRGTSALTQEVADTFNVLVWNVGFAFPTLDTDDQVFLTEYLDEGKSLFLSGQDVGWDLNSGNPAVAWYRSHLHALYIRDDTNIMDIVGVAGDPLTDGMDLRITGGDGASNQDYPDEISAYDADGSVILNYESGSSTYGAAVRSVDSDTGAHVIYLGFGFEAIDNAQDRQDLLGPAVTWLQGPIFRDGFESGDLSSWD